MSVVPSQILYLEHGNRRLYAEAIQVVDTRHLCWARPTLLICGLPTDGDAGKRQDAIASAATDLTQSALNLYALEECPDLIWPLSLFDIAYDLDFFSLLVQLKMNDHAPGSEHGREPLNQFIRSFWHAHTETFQPHPANG